MDIRHVFEKLSQQSLENKTLLSNVQTIIDENIEVKDEDLGSILNWLELLKEMTVQVLQLTGKYITNIPDNWPTVKEETESNVDDRQEFFEESFEEQDGIDDETQTRTKKGVKKEREKGVLTTKNKENGKRMKQKTRSKNEKVTCEKCNNNFKTRKAFESHIKRDHPDYRPYPCTECDKRFFAKDVLRKHINVHSQPYQCHFCEKKFSSQFLHRTHERVHIEGKTMICEMCGKGFSRQAELNSHLESHVDEKKHQCDICQKFFKSKNSLKTHRKGHSEGEPKEKKFKCTLCPWAFKYKSMLTIHMSRHAEDRPFKCTYYPVSFKAVADARAHEKTVHLSYRPHHCTFCDQTFKDRNRLQVHLNTHTGEKPFMCNVCGKQYSNRHSLSSHEVTHNEVGRYKCNFCPKTFHARRFLTQHTNTHTGAKPFKCDMCGDQFSHSATLYRHKKSHLNKGHSSTASKQPADGAGDAVPMSMQMPGSYMQLNVATAFNKETAPSVRLPYSQPVFPPI